MIMSVGLSDRREGSATLSREYCLRNRGPRRIVVMMPFSDGSSIHPNRLSIKHSQLSTQRIRPGYSAHSGAPGNPYISSQ